MTSPNLLSDLVPINNTQTVGTLWSPFKEGYFNKIIVSSGAGTNYDYDGSANYTSMDLTEEEITGAPAPSPWLNPENFYISGGSPGYWNRTDAGNRPGGHLGIRSGRNSYIEKADGTFAETTSKPGIGFYVSKYGTDHAAADGTATIKFYGYDQIMVMDNNSIRLNRSFIPYSNKSIDLGSSSYYFNNGYIANLKGNADTATKASTTSLSQGTTDAARFVIFQDANNNTSTLTPCYDADFKYNPVSNTLTVANVSGNASSSTNASYSAKVGTSTSHPAIGSATQPVYVNSDGIITAGTALGTMAYKAAGDYVLASSVGAKNGIASLDANGKVPSSQLPSYVDDVLEYDKKASFPSTGESGKIYVDKATNLTYRWGGSSYVEISASLALGETSSTAYAGDKGKQIRTDLDSHTSNTTVHITANERTAWNGKYTKPSSGIPKTDLASAVQTSLGKADSALQSISVSSSGNTASWGSSVTVGTVQGTNLTFKMPSNPNTDTKVTSAANHYDPAADAASALDKDAGDSSTVAAWNSTYVVTGVKISRDSKGHVTDLSLDSAKFPTNPNSNYYPTSFAWTNGTTAGPTGSLTGTGMSAVSIGAIPSASASTSGVVTTGAQTFAGSKTFTGTIRTVENGAAINFRSASTSYYTTVNYDTSGNEALAVNLKSSVTSFMVNSGVDGTTWTAAGKWTGVSPSLQVKGKSVYINELIPNGVTPAYTFRANGNSSINGTLGLADKVTLQYNSTTESLDFVFA